MMRVLFVFVLLCAAVNPAGAALLDLLQALVRERGMAAVVASHDPAVIARADRVIRLRDGAAVAA